MSFDFDILPASPSEAEGNGCEVADSPPAEPIESKVDSEEPPAKITRRLKRGGTDYVLACRSLGFSARQPPDLAFVTNWPRVVALTLLGGSKNLAARCRLKSMLRHGLLLFTEFSGCCGAETALSMLEVAFNAFGIISGWLGAWRYSEKKKVLFIAVKDGPRSPQHAYPSIESRMSEVARKYVLELRRQRKALLDSNDLEAVGGSYDDLNKYLMADPLAAFPRFTEMGACKHHPEQRCPSGFSRDAYRDHHGGNTAPPLTCSIAGFMCTPYSQFGRMTGDKHSGFETWLLYVSGEAADEKDIYFFENSPNCPISVIEEFFAVKFFIKYAILGPEVLQYPVLGDRLCVCVFRKTILLWTGNTDTCIANDIKDRFKEMVTLEMNDFAVNTDGARDALIVKLAGKHGVSNIAASELDFHSLLSESEAKAFELLKRRCDDDANVMGRRGGCVADLS